MDIFKNTANSIPKSDSQIVRVSMTEVEIGGRKDNLPKGDKSDKLAIRHVPSVGKDY